MGGSSYDRDVGSAPVGGTFDTGTTSSDVSKRELGRVGSHDDLNPKNKIITSARKNPVIIGLDVTGSNIEFARIIYDKAPMLHGQIEQQGYLKDFDICFAAIGDANGPQPDLAPLQVCDFKYGIELDKQLKKIWLEAGGGGQRKETYELFAYYLNNFCEIPDAEEPFLFIIGDEAPYPYLTQDAVKSVLGKDIPENIESRIVFETLFQKFKGNVFFLQNAYCGQQDQKEHREAIRGEWAAYIGALNAEKIVQIYEEKSVVDVILGKIATVTKARDMDAYIQDLKNKEQTPERIHNVMMSLGGEMPYSSGQPSGLDDAIMQTAGMLMKK